MDSEQLRKFLQKHGWKPFFSKDTWIHSSWVIGDGKQSVPTTLAYKMVLNKLYDKYEYANMSLFEEFV